MSEPVKKLSLIDRLLLLVSNIIPFHGIGPIGVISLITRRIVMQNVNLYNAPLENDASSSETSVPDHRTADGAGNDKQYFSTGSSNTAFGRNMPPNARRAHAEQPPVQVVAAKLLQRDTYHPAGDQFNVLAAAWIQAQAHDWFGHVDSDEVVELSSATPQCPLQSFRFKATKRRPDGAFDNFRTHWWDASFVYGQNESAEKRARTGKAGRLHMSSSPGLLPRGEDGTSLVGDQRNGWIGVSLLQDIFTREHNAVADSIANAHPELKDDDDKLFNYARLVVAAIVAKIHTVDWTVELLKTTTLELGMNSNWYGLFQGLGLSKDGPPGIFSLVAQDTKNHGVPYCLTEEFVSVYRMHPLLPDGLPLESGFGFVPLSELVGLQGDVILSKEGGVQAAWDALVRYPCGNLELHNYPRPLRDLPPTDDFGRALPDHVDLAALDLYRDRERGIRNYNDFRRGIQLKPFATYLELTGGNEAYAEKLEEVYGKDGIEHVDLMVGMFAEKKIKGFAISETAFLIFLLMASRRLEADRFFTTDYNEKTYTDIGIAWVKSVSSMRDVLKRHLPDIERKIPKGYSAFKPRDVWPAEHM